MKTQIVECTGKCDICLATDLKVWYDMPWFRSSWANVCEKCRQGQNIGPGTKFVYGKKKVPLPDLDEQAYADNLSMDMIEAMVMDQEDVTCVDGCVVEPDGTCPHGYKSPLLLLGII